MITKNEGNTDNFKRKKEAWIIYLQISKIGLHKIVVPLI